MILCLSKLYIELWYEAAAKEGLENCYAYLKGNSKISFSRKFLPRNKKNLFLGSKIGEGGG